MNREELREKYPDLLALASSEGDLEKLCKDISPRVKTMLIKLLKGAQGKRIVHTTALLHDQDAYRRKSSGSPITAQEIKRAYSSGSNGVAKGSLGKDYIFISEIEKSAAKKILTYAQAHIGEVFSTYEIEEILSEEEFHRIWIGTIVKQINNNLSGTDIRLHIVDSKIKGRLGTITWYVFCNQKEFELIRATFEQQKGLNNT